MMRAIEIGPENPGDETGAAPEGLRATLSRAVEVLAPGIQQFHQ